jgi:hypothetical protein
MRQIFCHRQIRRNGNLLKSVAADVVDINVSHRPMREKIVAIRNEFL